MRWDDEKTEMMISLSDNNSDERVAEIMSETYSEDITLYSIRRRRQRIGVKKMSGRGVIGISHKPVEDKEE